MTLFDAAPESNFWERVRASYALPPFDELPCAVPGGLRHQLFRFRAGRDYALKLLNPRFQNDALQGDLLAAAAAQAGLPAVVALPGRDGSVQPVGDARVMLFDWKPGTLLSAAPAAPDAAHQMGVLLARLHRLDFPLSEVVLSNTPSFPDFHWADLSRQGQKQKLAWSDDAAASLKQICSWSAAARQAQEELGPQRVTTHRDMDQKNILWSDTRTPWILDWEESGPMAPMLEVMGTALNWAGQAAGSPSEATFQAFLDGYQSHAPLDIEKLRAGAVGVLDKWLVWLEFNLRRSLRESDAPDAERVLATDAARHALTTLHALAAETPRRLDWCDSHRLVPASSS